MQNGTIAQFFWNEGITFSDLSRRSVDFFQQTDLHLSRHKTTGGDGIFEIWRGGAKFQFIDAPWECDPMLEPMFLNAGWSLIEPDGSRWGEFVYSWENNPGSTIENLGTRIFVVRLYFDGVFYSHRMSSEEFAKALRKYHLLKELVRALDCDELMGAHENYGDVLYSPKYKDPSYPYVDFRFARKGVQVLIRQMEEKRMLPETMPFNREQDMIYVKESD